MKTSQQDSFTNHDPFVLIEQGNEFETELKHFKASEAFLNASLILDEKAMHINSAFQFQTNHHKKPRNNQELEQTKIAALYQDKSLEYFHKARRCFISGLEREYDVDVAALAEHPSAVEQVSISMGEWNYKDKDNSSIDRIVNSLSKQDVNMRKILFEKLFSISINKDSNHDSNQTQVEQQHEEENAISKSLEERLAMLESSLPSRLKTDHERIKDLHKGLVSLGVTNHYTAAPTSHTALKEMDSLDEQDQVDQIVQMATDSVMLEGNVDSNIGEVMDIVEQYTVQDEESDDEQSDDDDDDGSIHDIFTNDTENHDPSMERVRNLIQSITQTQKDEIEESSKDESKSKNNKDNLKGWIDQAQQLLLQASLCLDESGSDKNKIVEDDMTNDVIVHDSQSTNENKGDNPADIETKSTTIDKTNTNPILEIGREGLLEIQKLVEQLLIYWPNE